MKELEIRHKQRGKIVHEDYCQVHQLIRIKTDSQYLSLTGRLTSNKDEAILVHHGHGEFIINQLKLRFKDRLFIQESNRN